MHLSWFAVLGIGPLMPRGVLSQQAGLSHDFITAAICAKAETLLQLE